MRRLLYIFLYPFAWIINGVWEFFYYFRQTRKESGFRWAFKVHVIHSIRDTIHDFFYEDHHNGIFGPGGRGWSTFKTGSLALVIAILTAIGFIVYMIFNK